MTASTKWLDVRTLPELEAATFLYRAAHSASRNSSVANMQVLLFRTVRMPIRTGLHIGRNIYMAMAEGKETQVVHLAPFAGGNKTRQNIHWSFSPLH